MLSKKLTSLIESSDDASVFIDLKDEAIELENIAYLCNGFFDSEASRNFGDADTWKFKLKQAVEKYEDRVLG